MRILDQFLHLAWRTPWLSRLVNRLVILYIAGYTTPRPRPWSLWSPIAKPADPARQGPVNDYASWPSLTDRSFSGRHLPPAPESWIASLPTDNAPDMMRRSFGAITSLFARKGEMKTDRSSLLFMFFAQWFTDSVMRIDPVDRRRNTSNHEIDLCQIYGLDEASARILRSFEGGRLRSQYINGEEMPDYLCEADGAGSWRVRAQFLGLPYSHRLDELFGDFPRERRASLYATGLERGNQSVGYVAINALFLREHNRLATELAQRNPDWDDERLFQTARLINTAILMKILIEDYINHVAGHKLFRFDTSFAEDCEWYRPNWITLEFDLIYRWHGMVPNEIWLGKESRPATEFRVNNALLESLGVSSVIDALSRQSAGKIGLGNTPTFLLPAEYASLRMGRDFRLRSYNDYREAFNLPRLKRFSALTHDAALVTELEGLYGSIDKLEFVTGLFAEAPAEGLLFGALLDRMVAYDAFTQILTNPLLSRNVFNAETFSAWGMQQIRRTSGLAALATRNLVTPAHVSLSA